MKNRAVIEHISLGMGVFDGIGTLERGGELRDRLVNFSAKPQAPGQHRPNRCSRILAGAARGQLLHLVARLEELYGSSALFYGFGQSSQEKKNPCVSAPCIEHYGPIVVLFGEGDQIHDHLVGSNQFAAYGRCSHKPKQHVKVFGRIAKPLAKLARATERRHRHGRHRTLGGDQAWGEDKLQVELQSIPWSKN